MTASLRERGTASAKIETGKGTGLQTGTEIERGIVGIPEPQIEPLSGGGAVNRGMREKRGRKSRMGRVKESEAVGRNGSTKSAPVVESEKGSAQKKREPKEKEMTGVTRMSEKRENKGRSASASGLAKAGVERGGTKVSALAGNVLGHAPGVVRNQRRRRRVGSASAATARSICTNAVTAENTVTAEMPEMGKTIREWTLTGLLELTFLTLVFFCLGTLSCTPTFCPTNSLGVDLMQPFLFHHTLSHCGQKRENAF